MKIAQVTEFGQPPKVVEVDVPPTPKDDDTIRIKVLAAGIHQVVRSRASGNHYSAQGLPHVPGIDGAGTTADGKLVYFISFAPQGGTMAEIVNMPKNAIIPAPEGLDPIQMAGGLNPAMSSWMALTHRTSELPKDFSVLIMGVTSASGSIAIDLAKVLGAKKVIGVARNVAKMSSLGLDETIELKEPATETDFSKARGVDVILDYLWGEPTLHMFTTLKPTKPVQYVQIGSLSSTEMNIPSAILRSNNFTIRGSGPGAWSMKELTGQLPALVQAFAHVKPQPVKIIPLKDIETAWTDKDTKAGRPVVVM